MFENFSKQIELKVKSASSLNDVSYILIYYTAYNIYDVPYFWLFLYRFVYYGQADHIYPGIPLK